MEYFGSRRVSTESPTRGKSLRLKRPYLWTLYMTAWGVWLSGALWLVFHYFFRVRGKFGHEAMVKGLSLKEQDDVTLTPKTTRTISD